MHCRALERMMLIDAEPLFLLKASKSSSIFCLGSGVPIGAMAQKSRSMDATCVYIYIYICADS